MASPPLDCVQRLSTATYVVIVKRRWSEWLHTITADVQGSGDPDGHSRVRHRARVAHIRAELSPRGWSERTTCVHSVKAILRMRRMTQVDDVPTGKELVTCAPGSQNSHVWAYS